jgi:hypothetical protein
MLTTYSENLNQEQVSVHIFSKNICLLFFLPIQWNTFKHRTYFRLSSWKKYQFVVISDDINEKYK